MQQLHLRKCSLSMLEKVLNSRPNQPIVYNYWVLSKIGIGCTIDSFTYLEYQVLVSAQNSPPPHTHTKQFLPLTNGVKSHHWSNPGEDKVIPPWRVLDLTKIGPDLIYNCHKVAEPNLSNRISCKGIWLFLIFSLTTLRQTFYKSGSR